MEYERSSTACESGWGTLTAVRDLARGEHIPIHTISLDAWSAKQGLDQLRAIKIDAEGSEVGILRGAQDVLRRFRPVLLLEVNSILLSQAGTSAGHLGEAVLRCGYQIYKLSGGRLRFRSSLTHCKFADCVCLPQENVEELSATMNRGGFALC
jgi:hypothetical protein